MNVREIQQAIAVYFRRLLEERATTKQYERAYRSNQGLGKEFEGWEEQGSWPGE